MTPDAIDLLLVYLLVLLCLIEMSAGVVAFCTLGRKSPKSRQTCRLALVVAMAAAAAGTAAYVTLGIRTGMIDLSPPLRGRLASEIRATRRRVWAERRGCISSVFPSQRLLASRRVLQGEDLSRFERDTVPRQALSRPVSVLLP